MSTIKNAHAETVARLSTLLADAAIEVGLQEYRVLLARAKEADIDARIDAWAALDEAQDWNRCLNEYDELF